MSVDHRNYRDANPTTEPLWHELWGLDNTGQTIYQGRPGSGGTPDADIDGRQALGITTGDPSVVVAVIDDGVDFSHPDLAARAWTNPGESGNGKETNGIDDDGNGYIDDVHGWDFCHNDNTVHDFGSDFHGTHVSGTIAASLDGVGVVGVAPGVSIMALKFIGPESTCSLDSQAIAAIAYARSFGVRIANASWGSTDTQANAQPLYDAIKTSGMLFVAAAGNVGADNDLAGPVAIPASFDLPNILSVAAVDNTGGLASFSNFGATTVDIAAPGVGILSALPADATYPNPGWGWLEGTSMAAPHVTGSAALVASMWPSLGADPIALKARLLASGKPDDVTTGLTVTGRIVDPFRALDVVGPVAAAPSGFAFVPGSIMSSTSIATRIGWPNATDDHTGVAAYGLEVQANGGSWTRVIRATTDRSGLWPLAFGTDYAFRVRARDAAANWGSWATSAGVMPARYQESSSLIKYHGSWGRVRTISASGGRTRFATHRNASVSLQFSGRAVGVIAPVGPTGGSVRLYVDGVYVSTINLYRSRVAPRIVVAARAWSVSGVHTVTLVVIGTARHPRVEIDAFAVVP